MKYLGENFVVKIKTWFLNKLSNYYTKKETDSQIQAVTDNFTKEANRVNAELNKKADKEETNSILAEKANTADVNSKFTEEKNRVDAELNKKFDKASVVQELGEAEDKVISQKAVSNKFNELITSLKAEFSYKGIATPTTNPGTPDGNVFYIAGEGTYVNFSNITIDAGQLGVLKWDGSWSKQVLELGASEGNMILEWNTDVATTRKSVPLKYRKLGLQVSYKKNNKEWITEQYIYQENYVYDTVWEKDDNWQTIQTDKSLNDKFETISVNSSKIRRVFDESAKFIGLSGSGDDESTKNGLTKEEANSIFRSISISKKLQGLFISVFYDNVGLRFTDGNKKVYAFDIAEYPDIMDKSIKSLTIEKNFDGTVFILNLNPSARVHRGFSLGTIETTPISDDVYLSDGQLAMQEIKNTKENLDSKFDKGTEKVLLQNLQYNTGFVNSDTGNVSPLGPNIYFTYYFQKGAFNKLSMYFQWQGSAMRGMAFYEDGEYISGDAGNNTRKVISIPDNANMLKYCLGSSNAIDTAQYFEFINDKDYNANTLKNETDIRFKDYSVGYTYPNLVSLSLLGGGNIFYASGTIRNAGLSIKPSSNISYEPVEQKGIYKFKSVSDIGTNEVFRFEYKRETPSKLYLSIQNIEGMKIRIRNDSGNTLIISTPTVIGIYKDNDDKPSITGEIIYVNSEYIFMSVISNRVDQGNLRFSFEGITYTEILIKHPTVLEDNNIPVDPNHYYQCEAEKNNSKWIGKNVMLFGDSQQNEQYVTIPLMNRFGFNIYNSAQGGHAIGFRTNEKNWLYSWNYDLMGNSGYNRGDVLKNPNIDLYLMLVSTNDNPSDNDKLELTKGEPIGSTGYFKFTNVALDEIKENYPWYGDNEETIASKLSKFNGLSLEEKKRIFAYKQAYAAYIAQLLEFNPKAQFVLSTIPICPLSFYENDGEGGVKIKEGYTATDIRGNYTTFETKNNIIKDVAKYFNLPVADGANYVNMAYENYHIFVNPGDYVHWTNQNNLIKRRWAQCIAGVIEDLYIE